MTLQAWRGGAVPPLAVARLELLHASVTPKTIWSFVRISASDGTSGVGEASLMGETEALDASFRTAREALTGATLARVLDYADNAPRPALADAAMASALEQAVWDLHGRYAGQPVWAMLGGAQRGIRLYANINRRTTDRSPAGFFASASEALACEFSALKIAPFDGLTPSNAESSEGRAHLERGLARVAAVRDAVGRATELYVDCHWRMTPGTARVAIGELGRLRVSWFECPLIETDAAIPALRALREHANAHGMVLAGLEELTSVDAFRPYLEAGAYDVVMPDVKYVGGLAALAQTAAAAAERGTACAPHNPTGPVCHAASLAVCAADPHIRLLEYQYDETPYFFSIAGPSLPRPSAGTSAVPDAPGLGIALDLDRVPVRSV